MEAEQIDEEILRQLRQRGPGKSICPSEVARSLFAHDTWRKKMDLVRERARGLARTGILRITQGERILDPEKEFRGPIRLRFR
mgnify:CR=1 FL=1